jgi:hypothetical protein
MHHLSIGISISIDTLPSQGNLCRIGLDSIQFISLHICMSVVTHKRNARQVFLQILGVSMSLGKTKFTPLSINVDWSWLCNVSSLCFVHFNHRLDYN